MCSFSVLCKGHLNVPNGGFEQSRAFTTIKVYMATISASHVGIDGAVVRFLKGAHCLRPVFKPIAQKWDLTLVLEVLCAAPFEPLGTGDLNIFS